MPKAHSLDPNFILSVAKGIAGAILADGKIHEKEEQFLIKFHKDFGEYPELLSKLDQLIQDRMPFHLDELKGTHPDIKLHLFETILEICSSDLDLDINEIFYINESAKTFKIDSELKSKLVIDVAFTIKGKLINRIVQDLSNLQIYYLVVTSLEVVYSSKYLVDKKLPYLDSLVRLAADYDLIGEDYAKEKLVDIDYHIREKFVKFFLELTMCDGIWSLFELEMIREIADKFCIDRERTEWLIHNTQISYRLLHEKY